MGKSILQTTMKAALRNSDGKISLGRIGESVFAGGLLLNDYSTRRDE